MTDDDLEALKKIGMEDWGHNSSVARNDSMDDVNPKKNGQEPEKPHILAMLEAKRAVNKLEAIVMDEQ